MSLQRRAAWPGPFLKFLPFYNSHTKVQVAPLLFLRTWPLAPAKSTGCLSYTGSRVPENGQHDMTMEATLLTNESVMSLMTSTEALKQLRSRWQTQESLAGQPGLVAQDLSLEAVKRPKLLQEEELELEDVLEEEVEDDDDERDLLDAAPALGRKAGFAAAAVLAPLRLAAAPPPHCNAALCTDINGLGFPQVPASASEPGACVHASSAG